MAITTDDILKKIDGFTELMVGWYGRGSVPAPVDRAARAQELVTKMAGAGYKHINAFPGDGGQIQVVGQKDGWEVEIDLDKGDAVSIYLEPRKAESQPAPEVQVQP